jgi:hypothetical protein
MTLRRARAAVCLVGITLVAAPRAAGMSSDRERAGQCAALPKAEAPITVHGRLYGANGGGSGFRIWIVGTRRIVWLSPKIDPAVPDTIRNAFKPFDEELYGDFDLVPLAPDRPGVMREVCFVSGEHLIVRDVRTGQSRPIMRHENR